MTEQQAIEKLQDMHDVAECRIKNGDKRGVIYIPEDELPSFDMAIKALEEVQQYRSIGTPEECRAAVEKQKAKKPTYDYYHRAGYRCQTCNNVNPWGYKHCKHCGQKLDWSGDE